jgi:hypothetical protein
MSENRLRVPPVSPQGDCRLGENNPYEAPTDAVRTSFADGNARHRAGAFTYTAWIFVFALNTAVPLLFSSSLTRQYGMLSMVAATLSLLLRGCTICAANRTLAV